MGAFSHDSFGNDDAADWAYELEASKDLVVVEQTLDQVLETGDDYLEAPEASRAIAAAETVARLKGNWGARSAYSKTVDQWVESHKLVPGAGLTSKAQQALDRILSEPSELLELWQDSDEFDQWKAAVADLRDRVS